MTGVAKHPAKPCHVPKAAGSQTPEGNVPKVVPDRFSTFKLPKGCWPLRRHVVERLGLTEGVGGVVRIVEDPQRADTMYVVSTKAARIDILVEATRLAGVEKDGNMRAYVQAEIHEVPVCPRCHRPHWQYQLCT